MKMTNAAKEKIAELNDRFVGKTVLKPRFDFTAKTDRLQMNAMKITVIKAENQKLTYDDGRCLIVCLVGDYEGEKNFKLEERRFLPFTGKDKWLKAATDLEKEFARWEAEAKKEPRYYVNDEYCYTEQIEFFRPVITADIEKIEDKIMKKAKEVAAEKMEELQRQMKKYVI